METRNRRIRYWAVGLFFVIAGFFSSEAFPWGFATHAYINDHLGKTKRFQNADEIYGSVAPDMFNYLFDHPDYLGFLSDQTHLKFAKLWDVSNQDLGKSLAYGFASHNETWGADSTAHHSGLTFGQGQGYVIAKAALLAAILAPALQDAGLSLPPELADEIIFQISHELVEDGIDILVKSLDPSIGQKLSSSALFRTSNFPVLVAKAYAGDFSRFAGISYQDASKFIIASEKEFRERIVLYGQALMQDDDAAIHLISQGTAEVAATFLEAYGVAPLPPMDLVVALIEFGIEQSINLCADDFAQEVAATIDFVNQNLEANKISY